MKLYDILQEAWNRYIEDDSLVESLYPRVLMKPRTFLDLTADLNNTFVGDKESFDSLVNTLSDEQEAEIPYPNLIIEIPESWVNEETEQSEYRLLGTLEDFQDEYQDFFEEEVVYDILDYEYMGTVQDNMEFFPNTKYDIEKFQSMGLNRSSMISMDDHESVPFELSQKIQKVLNKNALIEKVTNANDLYFYRDRSKDFSEATLDDYYIYRIDAEKSFQDIFDYSPFMDLPDYSDAFNLNMEQEQNFIQEVMEQIGLMNRNNRSFTRLPIVKWDDDNEFLLVDFVKDIDKEDPEKSIYVVDQITRSADPEREYAEVIGHEGRHRMTAMGHVHGDMPTDVLLTIRIANQRRKPVPKKEVPEQWYEKMDTVIMAERGSSRKFSYNNFVRVL